MLSLAIPLALAVLLAVGGSGLAQTVPEANPEFSSLMKAMAARKSAAVTFRETKWIAALSEPIVLRGTLHYRAPGMLRKTVVSPAPQTFSIEGDELTIRSGDGEERLISLEDHEYLRAFTESIRATLAGQPERLRQYYRLEFKGTRRRWTLILFPRNELLAQVVLRIEIRGKGIDLERITIEEVGGDRSVMRIEGVLE